LSKFNIPLNFKKECWEWQGAKTDHGYGKITENGKNTKQMVASRVSWEYWNCKKIPKNFWVLHNCDNPGCVNPYHLRVGLPKDNSQDMCLRKRTNAIKVQGEKSPRSKLTNEKVLEIRKIGKEKILTHKQIGSLFNIDASIVTRVINRQRWKHI
jgi:hypothetical protein